MTVENLENNVEMVDIDLEDFNPDANGSGAPGVEVSADLAHFVPYRDEPDETLTPQQLADKNKELAFEKKLKAEGKRGREITAKALAAAESLIMRFTGARNTGLTDADRQQFAKDMAPILVELGVTDYGTMFSKYGRYLTAAYAAYSIGAKMVKGVAADLEKQAQEQDAGLKKQPEQKRQDFSQDFAGRGQLIAVGEVVPDGY